MKKLALFAVACAFSGSLLAAAADQLAVDDATVRLAPPSAPATAAFMVLRNTGNRDLKVVKAESPAARVTELHTHINDNGMMRMRPVPALDVKAGEKVVLQPGGLHVMLIDLRAPLKEGDNVTITLGLDDGSSKKLEARVVNPMAMPAAPAMPHQHSMH